MLNFEPDFLLSELAPNKFFQTPKKIHNCKVCQKQAKYQCPKCHLHYCDLSCYKTHNPECPEEFYKEQVIQHMKGKKASEAEILNMKKLLHKYKDNNGESSPEIEIDEKILAKKLARLEELKNLLEIDELTIEKLSIEEQKEFAIFVEEQKNTLSPWKPYWWIEDVKILNFLIVIHSKFLSLFRIFYF